MSSLLKLVNINTFTDVPVHVMALSRYLLGDFGFGAEPGWKIRVFP
jgi:hypothetical protein